MLIPDKLPNRPAPSKTIQDVAQEWDNVAARRVQQLLDGTDVTYLQLLLPTAVRMAAKADLARVVDIGCGVGFLTAALAKISTEVVAIDLSPKSIREARALNATNTNTRFVCTDFNSFAAEEPGSTFSCAIAHMALPSMLNLKAVIEATAYLLCANGSFIITIPHPCFWPSYWGYSREEWFDYLKETGLEREFILMNDQHTDLITTYFHRPLSQYLNSLLESGFVLTRSEEFGGSGSPGMPSKYPKFLVLTCGKKSALQT